RHFGGRSFSRPSFRGNRSFAVHNARPNAVRALSPRAATRAMRNAGALRNPAIRAGIIAGAATAGWHGARGGAGWWQHGNGGYGWVGPLFWPFAYYDINDYAMWGSGYGGSFWNYGYDDIYAGIFAPYGYNDLLGYRPQYASRTSSRRDRASRAYAAVDPLAQMCGDDNGELAGFPVDQIKQAIQLNDAQRTALDDVANASAKAAQTVKSACPADISLTAPNRLAVMQQRIEAMISAAGMLQPPLQRFYDVLNDEQKALLTALIENQRGDSSPDRRGNSNRRRTAADPVAQPCGMTQPGLTEWPNAEIEGRVHPNDAQRASLAALQDAAAKAADMLRASCQPDGALTPPARLTAIGKRLDAMLEAVKTVRSALDAFYGALTDEQKAQFESIGRLRTGMLDRPKAA
ncbi:MAG TPA: Spy/CpxP family protein refolding chaperone, partial [Bradyrhizobium sp.]|nr:Spy/CpxP family protein refolding chaperone [Bradyrhizobium sp.]